MPLKKCDLVIVNRSFWPVYPVIGEALLKFAEELAEDNVCVNVISQDHENIRSSLSDAGRGHGVGFRPCRAFATSSSSVLVRILDALFFMFWVGMMLVQLRPKKVYVSTDPPIVVPFIVCIYSKLFSAKYVYHLQDIHPEAAQVVVPVNPYIYRFTRWLDSYVMKNAFVLITLTVQMAEEICSRTGKDIPINILDNPAVSFSNIIHTTQREAGFVFCGNAGRLQRIPLLLDAISQYLEQGGKYKFVFAGGGVYSEQLKLMSERFSNCFSYLGQIPPQEAAQLNVDYSWALLPIEDDVTRYAFPSKSSSYVYSGALVLAICGEETSVADWVKSNRLGIVVKPEVNEIVTAFKEIELSNCGYDDFDMCREELKERLNFNTFVEHLRELVFGKGG